MKNTIILSDLKGFLTSVVDDAEDIIDFNDYEYLASLPSDQYIQRGNLFLIEKDINPTLIFDCIRNNNYEDYSFRGTLLPDRTFAGNIIFNKENNIENCRFSGIYYLKKNKYLALCGKWEERGNFVGEVFVLLVPGFEIPDPKKPDLHVNTKVKEGLIKNNPQTNNIKFEPTIKNHESRFHLIKKAKDNELELCFGDETLNIEVNKIEGIFVPQYRVILDIKSHLNIHYYELPRNLKLLLNTTEDRILFSGGNFEILYNGFQAILKLEIGFNQKDLLEVKFNPYRLLNETKDDFNENRRTLNTIKIEQRSEGIFIEFEFEIATSNVISKQYQIIQKMINKIIFRELKKMNYKDEFIGL
jgi:hypothetical protein